MIKRFSALILCALVLFTLASCNRKGTDDTLVTPGTTDVSDITTGTTKTDPNLGKPVFDTDGITKMALFSGYGKTSHDVPAEHMEEITAWLGTITVGENTSDKPSVPGTGFYHVEIEYSDGKVIKAPLDTTKIGETTYHTVRDPYPDAFYEIFDISK